ncbi:hypothetical protein [Chryseobacterium daeguense]|uniref:hypothetical protein n=1 Tax=Chryseobacterium daeguense TaxID=412438 RepID=UPI0003F96269|nr:hypothetical protein [Chryseobacterium daeguense]
MKNYYVIAFLAINSLVYSQVGINTTTPLATLDIVAKADSKTPGLLPPRLNGDDIKTHDNDYDSNLAGTIVYAKAPVSNVSTKTTNITRPGYYYFDGNIWKSMTNSFLTGNAKIVATDYTASDDDCLIETRALPYVKITLPAATALNKGKIYVIYNSNNEIGGGNQLKIETSSSSIIGTQEINIGKGKMVVSDGSRWIIVGY